MTSAAYYIIAHLYYKSLFQKFFRLYKKLSHIACGAYSYAFGVHSYVLYLKNGKRINGETESCAKYERISRPSEKTV